MVVYPTLCNSLKCTRSSCKICSYNSKKIVFKLNRLDLNTIFYNFLLICYKKHEICEIMTKTEQFNLFFEFEKVKKFSRYKNVSSRKDILLKNINIFFKDVSYDNFGNGFSNPSTFDSSSKQTYLFYLKKGVIYFWILFLSKEGAYIYFKVSSVFFKACSLKYRLRSH